MKNRGHKILSLLLAITMIISVWPASSAMAVWNPNPTAQIVKESDSPVVFLFPSGSSMVTGFYHLGNGGNNEIAYCVDREAPGPVDVQYNVNDAGIPNQQYLAGCQAIIQHGYPYTTNGLSNDEARYATQVAIHWLENYFLGGTEGWEISYMDRTQANGHPAALAWAKALYAVGTGGTASVLWPTFSVDHTSTSWTNVNGVLEAYVDVSEADCDSWNITVLPAGCSIVGGNGDRHGSQRITIQMTDPAAYGNAASHTLQLMSYTNKEVANMHVFSTNQGTQTMIALSGIVNSDPESANLPAGYGEVQIQKYTRTTKGDIPEANASFVLYPDSYPSYDAAVAAGASVGSITTDSSGFGRSGQLILGNYVLHQTVAPEGSVVTSDRIINAKVYSAGDPAETVINNVSQGTVEIHKTTNYTVDQPEAGATFQVYLVDYPTYQDAVNAGSTCATITTDETGYAKTPLLDYGTYVIHQSGWPADTKPVADRTVGVGVVNNDNTVLNLVNETYWGDIEIQKYRATASDPADRTPEVGAVFVVYPSSFANYAVALSGDPKAADTCDVITTGADGIGRSTHPLPYGTYICEQIDSAATTDTFKAQPWLVTIGAQDNQHYTYERTNQIYEQYLKIVKTNAVTGQAVPLAGATFHILAADMETVLSDRNGKSDFKTDATGQIDLSDMPLLVGTYYIQETIAPIGYTLNPDPVRFAVQLSDHGSSQVTVSMGKDIRTEEISNTRQTCSLSVEKLGETLITATKMDAKDAAGNVVKDGDGNALSVYDFHYEQRPMNGASFDVYAGSKDIVNEYGVVLYHANELIGSISTVPVKDSLGGTKYVATLDGLPLGADGTAQYVVKESTAPVGQTLSTGSLTFNFSYSDQTLTEISQSKSLENAKQDVRISVTKQKESATWNDTTKAYDYPIVGAEGIVFGLYTANDILSPNGTVIVKKDSLVDLLITGSDGKAMNTQDLPFGSFYAKELRVTEEIVWDKNTVYPVTVQPSADGTTQLVTAALNNGRAIVNRTIKGQLDIYKLAADTDLPMSGVVFEIFNQAGTLVDTITTDKYGKADTKILPYGSYYMNEIATNRGYILGDTTYFSIFRQPLPGELYSDTDLTLYNDKMATISVSKVTKDGEIPMDGVVIGIYDSATGKEISRLTTDKDGNGSVYVTPGNYYLQEIETWPGYALAPDKIEVKNAAFAQVYHIALNNQPTGVRPQKSNPSGEPLPGTEFMVTDLAGTVIKMYWDAAKSAYVALDSPKFQAPAGATVVDRAVSGQDGSLLILGLIADKQYIITETKAPPGYNNDSKPVTITVPKTSDVLGTARFVDTHITVKTGESGDMRLNVAQIASVAALAIAAGSLVIVRRQRRKKEEKGK